MGRIISTAGVIISAVITAVSCRPDGGIADGLPATEDGVSEIQIVAPCTRAVAFPGYTDTTTTSTVLQLPVAIPFEHQSWRASALDSIG
jgi:hypothetical protein